MKQLKFDFWGSEHEVDYSYSQCASDVTAFVVYPKDEEIRIMIGDSKTFVFHKERGEIIWDSSDKSKILHKLCKAIADALMERNTNELR